MDVEFTHAIRRVLHKTGWELHRYRPSADPAARLAHLISERNIDLVYDVGANVGQFAKEIRESGYRGQIVSCEPLSAAHAQLTQNSSTDPAWVIASRCAIGAENGTTQINVSANSVSSSVLPMHENLRASAPAAEYVGVENVTVTTLDAIQEKHGAGFSRSFLKIDTQGYEWAVLDGAEKVLKGAAAGCIETSLVPLYEGQRLWLDVILRLISSGFTIWDIQPAFTSTEGRLMQADVTFART